MMLTHNCLRSIRKSKGLTLAEVAERTGTTNQQISHLEHGRRQLTLNWIDRLARALDCHPAEIIGVKDIIKDNDENDLMTAYRKMTPEQKVAIGRIIAAMVGNVDE